MTIKLGNLNSVSISDIQSMNPCEAIDQLEGKLQWLNVQLAVVSQILATTKEVLDIIKAKLNCQVNKEDE